MRTPAARRASLSRGAAGEDREDEAGKQGVGQPHQALPGGGGQEGEAHQARHLVLGAGADGLADQDGAGAGQAEGGHERDRVDLHDRHQRGQRGGAQARHHDVDEDDEGDELEEPVEARGDPEAQHAPELAPVQAGHDAAQRRDRRAGNGPAARRKQMKVDNGAGQGGARARPWRARPGCPSMSSQLPNEVEHHGGDVDPHGQPGVAQAAVVVAQRLHARRRRPPESSAQVDVPLEQAAHLGVVGEQATAPGASAASAAMHTSWVAGRHRQPVEAVAARARQVALAEQLRREARDDEDDAHRQDEQGDRRRARRWWSRPARPRPGRPPSARRPAPPPPGSSATPRSARPAPAACAGWRTGGAEAPGQRREGRGGWPAWTVRGGGPQICHRPRGRQGLRRCAEPRLARSAARGTGGWRPRRRRPGARACRPRTRRGRHPA